MKFFAAFVAILAVAVASPLKPATSELAQLEAIVAAINSPSTDPATAALLEAQLAAIIGANNPISVGAPIVSVPESVVLPAPAVPEVVLPEPGVLPIIPQLPIISPMPVVQPVDPISPIVLPMPVVEPTPVVEPVVPSPVVVGDVPAGSSPLVQIIVNVNEAASAAPTPVQAADNVVSPVQVVSPVEVSPVQVVETIVPGPVNIVDHPVSVEVPVVVDPVAVGTPILPAPVMTLPEELN